MAESHWTSYIGMVSGIIGTITGIAGAIMGYISYKRSHQLKSLYLRLESKISINELNSSCGKLKGLISRANQSRITAAEASGRSRSGMMEQWKRDIEIDKNKIAELSKKILANNNSYESSKMKELESRLVEIHAAQCDINQMTEKYTTAIAEDDNQINHHREYMKHRDVKNNG